MDTKIKSFFILQISIFVLQIVELRPRGKEWLVLDHTAKSEFDLVIMTSDLRNSFCISLRLNVLICKMGIMPASTSKQEEVRKHSDSSRKKGTGRELFSRETAFLPSRREIYPRDISGHRLKTVI